MIRSSPAAALHAASLWFQVHAHNVANLNTKAFRPQRVEIGQDGEGHPEAHVFDPPEPPPRRAPDPLPTSEVAVLSRTDLVAETVNKKAALAMYRANARVATAHYELSGGLLQIL